MGSRDEGTATALEKIGLGLKCWRGVMLGLLIFCLRGDLEEDVFLECDYSGVLTSEESE